MRIGLGIALDAPRSSTGVASNTPDAFVSGDWTISPPAADTSLFGASDDGFIYDFSDTSTLYTDLLRQTQVTQSTDPIGSVEDKSGKGNHRSAPNSSSKPDYIESGGLAYAVMGASGSTRLELDAVISNFASVDDFTLVAVYATHADASERPITVGAVSSADYAIANEDLVGSQYRAQQTTGELTVNNNTTADTTGTIFMVTVMKRGSEGLHYIDGSLVETDTGLGTWDADLSPAGSTAAIRGDSSEVVYLFAINRSLSDTELSNLHDLAKSKGGIT